MERVNDLSSSLMGPLEISDHSFTSETRPTWSSIYSTMFSYSRAGTGYMNCWIRSGTGSNSIGGKRYKRAVYPIPWNINWIGKEVET